MYVVNGTVLRLAQNNIHIPAFHQKQKAGPCSFDSGCYFKSPKKAR